MIYINDKRLILNINLPILDVKLPLNLLTHHTAYTKKHQIFHLAT